MPTKRPRKKAQLKLSADEIEEMEALGFEQEEMDEMEARLARTSWEFQSKARYFRLELRNLPDLLLASGKRKKNTDNLTAKFLEHIYPTRDRTTAFLIYCSDAFRDERVWDRGEAEEARIEDKYQEFKEMVSKDPEKFKRLQEDLAAEEQVLATA
jgi:hypothetical protein